VKDNPPMLVPVQYNASWTCPNFDQLICRRLQVKFSTSAPLRPEVRRRAGTVSGKLLEYWPDRKGRGHGAESAEHPDKLHTVGQTAPGNEFADDEAGKEVPKGEVGEICGRGPTIWRANSGRDDLTADYIWRDEAGTSSSAR